MDAAHGSANAALKPLNRGIREYSLFQGVLLVLDRLRQLNPGLAEESLYERLEFQANPSLGFPGSDIEQVQFFQEPGAWRAPAHQPGQPVRRRLAAAGLLPLKGTWRPQGRTPDRTIYRPVQQPHQHAAPAEYE